MNCRRPIQTAAFAILAACGSAVEPSSEGADDVAASTQPLLSTSPRGTRWVVPIGASGINMAGAVEIVFDSQYAYWLSVGSTSSTSPIPARISRAPRTGASSSTTVAELPGELGRDLAIRGSTLYFGTDKRIGAVETNGTGLRTLSSDARLYASGDIAVDSSYVYWPRQESIVKRVPLGGGTSSTVASGASMGNLALDDTYVYWTERGITDTSGRVRRAPKAGGGTPMTVVSGQKRPWHLGVSATHILFTDGGFPAADGTEYPTRIRRKPRDGSGTVETLRTVPYVRSLELSGDFLFWVEGTVIRRMSTTTKALVYVSTHEVPSEGSLGILGADAANVAWTVGNWIDSYGVRLIPRAEVASSACPTTADIIADADVPLGIGTSGTWTFFTEQGSGAGDGRVRRVWRNGSSVLVDIRVDGNSPANLTAKLNGVSWTEVRPEGGYLVFQTPGSGPGWAVTTAYDGVPLDLTADSDVNLAYVIQEDGKVRMYNYYDAIAGQGEAVDVGSVSGVGAGITDAGAFLYVSHTSSGAAAVSRLPKAGGTATPLASFAGDTAGRLAIDSAYVFYHTEGGRLLRAPLGGGTPTVLKSGLDGIVDIALDGSYVYLSVQGEGEADVVRVSKSTGALTTLASRLGDPWELDTDGTCVVYALTHDDGSGEIVKVHD